MAIGSIYFAKGRPSFDVYVHLLRLGLIIVVVTMLARTGLIGVSLGMGVVEATVSIFGQLLVCALTDITLVSIAEAMLPGIRLAVFCTLAAFAGGFMAALCHVRGIASLLVTSIPPAVVFCVKEFGTVREFATVQRSRPAKIIDLAKA